MLAETPCTDILGLVIYDLPGRDCAAKASNGELKTGKLSTYESQYIDRKLPLSSGFLASIANTIGSNCCCHQGRSKCCCRSDHRARFPSQLGHQRQLNDLLSLRFRLQGRCRICSQEFQYSQRYHVHRCWSRRMARMGCQPTFVIHILILCPIDLTILSEPGADMISGVYKTAGSPQQVFGVSTNVTG
jgi:hypothetical protein